MFLSTSSSLQTHVPTHETLPFNEMGIHISDVSKYQKRPRKAIRFPIKIARISLLLFVSRSVMSVRDREEAETVTLERISPV